MVVYKEMLFKSKEFFFCFVLVVLLQEAARATSHYIIKFKKTTLVGSGMASSPYK